jgi:hypothetical protein
MTSDYIFLFLSLKFFLLALYPVTRRFLLTHFQLGLLFSRAKKKETFLSWPAAQLKEKI